ncbi:MAG: aminotransferase class V-fold PLP-dependent enzyme [Bacteriovoracaceae bacterium]
MNWEKVRTDFPELKTLVHGKRLVYLDNAASTIKPKVVIDKLVDHYSHYASNIHRGIHFLSEKGTREYEETRKAIKIFINAGHEHEVIFTKGTTDSINLVASSYGELLKAGDEIILSTLEHHSNIVPWQILAEKKGLIIKVIPINEKGEMNLEEYKKLLSPRTALVSINFISNALGTINPVKEIISMAHKVGAKVMIDAAQAVLHTKVDVQDIDCDFLAFSAHKLLGPTGVGILYGKEKLLNQMPPYQGGGDMIDVVSFDKTTYNELPLKFEAGTPHIAGVIAFKDAIDYVTNLGLKNIAHHEHDLLVYATEKLSTIPGMRFIGTAEKKASVISFNIDGLHPQDIATFIDRDGVAIRTGHHCAQPLMQFFKIAGTCRASVAFYNTPDDIDELHRSLMKVREILL